MVPSVVSDRVAVADDALAVAKAVVAVVTEGRMPVPLGRTGDNWHDANFMLNQLRRVGGAAGKPNLNHLVPLGVENEYGEMVGRTSLIAEGRKCVLDHDMVRLHPCNPFRRRLMTMPGNRPEERRARVPRLEVFIQIRPGRRGEFVIVVMRRHADDGVVRVDRPRSEDKPRVHPGLRIGSVILVVDAHHHKSHVLAPARKAALEIKRIAVARPVRTDDFRVARDVRIDLRQRRRPFGVSHRMSARMLFIPVVAVVVSVHREEWRIRKMRRDHCLDIADLIEIVALVKGLQRNGRGEVTRVDEAVERSARGNLAEQPDRGLRVDKLRCAALVMIPIVRHGIHRIRIARRPLALVRVGDIGERNELAPSGHDGVHLIDDCHDLVRQVVFGSTPLGCRRANRRQRHCHRKYDQMFPYHAVPRLCSDTTHAVDLLARFSAQASDRGIPQSPRM